MNKDKHTQMEYQQDIKKKGNYLFAIIIKLIHRFVFKRKLVLYYDDYIQDYSMFFEFKTEKNM